MGVLVRPYLSARFSTPLPLAIADKTASSKGLFIEQGPSLRMASMLSMLVVDLGYSAMAGNACSPYSTFPRLSSVMLAFRAHKSDVDLLFPLPLF